MSDKRNYESFPAVTVTEYGEKIGPFPLCGSDLDVTESSFIWSGDGFDKTYASGRGLVHIGKCESFVDLDEISDSHYALTCRGCHLRVCVPLRVKTWKQLRKHFAKFVRITATRKRKSK